MAYPNLNRFPSIAFTSDDDNDDDPNSKDLVFSTPKGKVIHSLEVSPAISTSKLSKRTKCLTTTTTASSNNNNIELINLITPTKNIHTIDQPNYLPRTIHFYNQQRLSILPTFPIVSYNDTPHLLLANVSMNQLSSEELARRETGKYRCKFIIVDPDPSASSIMMKTYHQLFTPIYERFHIDLAILDHNYGRLKAYIDLFRSARNRILCTTQDRYEPMTDLNENELPQLLEFYLQIDVDLFYMKTCSFRDAQPCSINQGLFCSNQPQCCYTMSRCDYCELCSMNSPVQFNRYERYRFVNGYESILNCPASCKTTNFIYVLTCVCGEFDFVSETKFSLGVRLQGHRRIANNLIRKSLVGEQNLKHIRLTDENKISTQKENMLLYRHTMQCSAAIQCFLDHNPSYWAFVPLPIEEANQKNNSYQQMHTINHDIELFLKNIPKPPQSYQFSKRQIDKQIEFFQRNMLNAPFNDQVNVYKATIIALLPPNTSDLFRRIVHSLFVTHTEAKLNTLGHIFDSSTRTIILRNRHWCDNLIRRSSTCITKPP